jgi:hypothetical protein
VAVGRRGEGGEGMANSFVVVGTHQQKGSEVIIGGILSESSLLFNYAAGVLQKSHSP